MSSPSIIAHRGGKQNWPENTLCAFRQNLRQGVDAIELDVQVTQNDEVVVYHPEDLSVWTNGSGPVAMKTAAEVTALDASVKYQGPETFKSACSPEELRIPKLTDVLAKIPNVPIVVDLKSLPAEKLVNVIVKNIPAPQWSRLRFYSTSPEHTRLLREQKSEAVIFEDRNETFQRLMTMAATKQCTIKNRQPWVGYELVRDLDVCDKTKLGSTCLYKFPFEMWNSASVQCTRMMTGAKIVFFGINTKEELAKARRLGADAVFTDNPATLLTKSNLGTQYLILN